MSTAQVKVDYEYKVSGVAAASAEMNKMGTSADKAAGGLNKTTASSETAAEGMIKLAAKLGLAMVAYRAFNAVVAFAKESILAAVDANEDMNKFLVVMGDNANRANDILANLASTTNRNVYELRALSAGLQDMLVPMGVSRDQASGLSTDFTQLAIDLSSFNNVPVEEVMNALKSGMAGLSRPMRNFGVDLRMATVDQELLNMGIMGGYEAATTADRAVAIYNLTLKQSQDAQGDAARTADEAANVLVGFKSAISEAQVALGEEFLPVIEELVPLLRDELAKALPVLQEIAERIATDMLKYGPTVIKYMGLVIENVAFAVDKFEELEGAMQWMGGPGVWAVSKAIEYFGESELEAAERADLFAGAIDSVINPLSRMADALRLELQYTEDLDGAILTVTNFTKNLTRAQIAAAMATVELNRVEVQRSIDLKGMVTPALAERIAQMDSYVLRLKAAAGEIGAIESSSGGTSGGGSRGGTGDIEGKQILNAKELLELNRERMLVIQETALLELSVLDAQEARINEKMQNQIDQAAAQMEPLIAAANRSTDIMVNGLFKGFDSIKAGFKNMLADMASEWMKSQMMRLLFSTGAKAATGGVGGFFL